MTFIQWDDSLSVGVSEIDEQHKELINRINRLLESMKSGKGKDEAKVTIDFLEDYVVDHLKAEENYMLKYNYPEDDFIEHKKEHQYFIKVFNDIKKTILEKDISSTTVIMLQQMLTTWLSDHIYNSDKDMGKYLKKTI